MLTYFPMVTYLTACSIFEYSIILLTNKSPYVYKKEPTFVFNISRTMVKTRRIQTTSLSCTWRTPIG